MKIQIKGAKKALRFILSTGLFAVGALIVGFGWYQIYRWYLGLEYLPGVDFYVTATHVRQLLDNFNLPPLVWKYYWYSGYPFSLGYLIFHFYLALPFAKFLGLVRGIQNYAMFSLFIFSFSSYLLFSRVSKNKIFAALLAVATIYSANLYGALVWAGAIPSFATQAFLPLILFFLITYFQKEKLHWLYLAGLCLGFSILGHPLVSLIHVLPITFFFAGIFPYREGKFLPVKRIKDATVFYLVAFFTGITQIYPLLQRTLKLLFAVTKSFTTVSPAGGPAGAPAAQGLSSSVLSFYFTMVEIGTNKFLFLALAVLVFPLLLRLLFKSKRKAALIQLLPTLFSVVYLAFYIFAYAGGLPIPKVGWYRAFWPIPLIFAFLAAQLWGEMKRLLERIKAVGYLVELVLLLATAGLVFYFSRGMTTELEVPVQVRQERNATDPMLSIGTNLNGAYPFYYLNTKFSDQELKEAKAKLVPPWFNKVTEDHQFYVLDATIRVWWNALYDIPLATGYIEAPVPFEAQGYWFWMHQALLEEGLIEDWEKSYEQALNNAKFIIDWHGIGAIEAGCVWGRVYCLLISDYLVEEGIVDQPEDIQLPTDEGLSYYRVKPEETSPIIQPTDTTNILVISDEEGFEQIVRALAYLNLNSKNLVLVRDTQLLDKVSLSDLKNFKAVVLYNYQYKNWRAWESLLGRFVEEGGGGVFIETGSEVKDSGSDILPPLFPMEKTSYEPLGKDWDLEANDFARQFDLDRFSPPIYEEYPWKFSLVAEDSDLESDTKVILRNHGKPVLIEKNYGKGKIIWSGLNLPYHLNRYDNFEEVKLFEEILDRLSGFHQTDFKGGEYTSEFKGRKAAVEGDSAPRGILFRQQAFPGWRAKITSEGKSKNIKIYKAGPITPGFIYVNIPKEMRGKPYQVEFNYYGGPQVWFFFLVNVGAILFVLEKGLVGGRLTQKARQILFSRMTKRVKERWEDEEI